MKYDFAWDIQSKMREIVAKLGMNHVLVDNVVCIRGSGSQSRRTIARCHALNKIMQKDGSQFSVLLSGRIVRTIA